MALNVHKQDKWFLPTNKEPHKILVSLVEGLEDTTTRRMRNKASLAAYLNHRTVGFRPDEQWDYGIDLNLALNATRSVVDAIASQIATHHPRPFFLTNNGSYQDQTRAKNLQRFVQGIYSQNNVYNSSSRQAFLDATILDIGAIKVFPSHGQIKIECVSADEIWVDESVSQTRDPRELYQIKYVTRDVLASFFPKKADVIRAAQGIASETRPVVTDLIRVIEAWHLPSKPGADDGRHVIAIDTDTLQSDIYLRDRYPFAFMRWGDRRVGFYGQGLVEQLLPIQCEINKTAENIQEAVHLLGKAWVIVDRNSKTNVQHIKNQNAIILEKQGGQDPKVVAPPPFNPNTFQYLDYLYNKAFEIAGISQLTAVSRKPQDIESGVALRTLRDIESNRFGLVIRDYEQLVGVDVARLVVETACEMEDMGIKLTVNSADRKWFEEINFKDCRMDRDRFTIDVYPTSMLPQTPAGKLATIQELMGTGIITRPDQALAMLDLPDLEKFVSVETSNVDAAHQLCEFILGGDNRWIPPEKFMDLKLFTTIAQKHWVRGHVQGVPEERLEALGRWMDDANEIVIAEEQRLAAQQAALAQPVAASGAQIAPQTLPNQTAAADNINTDLAASLVS